jgi:hypothetical protein
MSKNRLENVEPSGRRSRLLAILAHATLAYPLIVLGLLYGQWLVAWIALGHKPSLWGNDDPKFITVSSWMHPVTAIALLAMLPLGFTAIVSNIVYILKYRLSSCQATIRLHVLLGLWLGTLVSLFQDPHGIVQWWID